MIRPAVFAVFVAIGMAGGCADSPPARPCPCPCPDDGPCPDGGCRPAPAWDDRPAVPEPPAADPGPKLTIIRYTADWCGPCRSFDGALNRPDVRDAILSRFGYVRHDLTADRSMQSVAGKGVTGIPLLVAADPSGAEVSRLAGNQPADAVLAWVNGLD